MAHSGGSGDFSALEKLNFCQTRVESFDQLAALRDPMQLPSLKLLELLNTQAAEPCGGALRRRQADFASCLVDRGANVVLLERKHPSKKKPSKLVLTAELKHSQQLAGSRPSSSAASRLSGRISCPPTLASVTIEANKMAARQPWTQTPLVVREAADKCSLEARLEALSKRVIWRQLTVRRLMQSVAGYRSNQHTGSKARELR